MGNSCQIELIPFLFKESFLPSIDDQNFALDFGAGLTLQNLLSPSIRESLVSTMRLIAGHFLEDDSGKFLIKINLNLYISMV